jgi:hypothetical protein
VQLFWILLYLASCEASRGSPALAVLALVTSSNLVACSIGKSAGFALLSFPKIISGRNGGGAQTRLGWLQQPQSVEPSDLAAHPCSTPSACGPHCTTRQHNTHRTEEREVVYPWHPWFGLAVFVHETMKRDGAGVLRCSQSSEDGVRCLEMPEWMFDRAACCGMVRGESPRVSRAGLDRLKALISVGFGGSSGGVIEARSSSLSQKGEADAPSGSHSCPAPEIVVHKGYAASAQLALFRPASPKPDWLQLPADTRERVLRLITRLLRERRKERVQILAAGGRNDE